jgi:hypothetical protein
LNQPQATATVKEQNDILPKNDNVGDGTVGVVFPDTAEMKPMVAVFCDQNAAILAPPTPKRLRELPAAGQILPPPRKDQMKIGDISDYGWFGALLSGAACALLLFLALNRGGISGIINPDYESGQANVSQAVLPDNALTPAGSQAAGVSQPNFFNITENFSAGDPLKEAVDLLARFFKGY